MWDAAKWEQEYETRKGHKPSQYEIEWAKEAHELEERRKIEYQVRVKRNFKFDEEFRKHIDKCDEWSAKEARFITNEYRHEISSQEYSNLSGYTSTSTGEKYKWIILYDKRRLEYVMEKATARFGSIENAIAEAERQYMEEHKKRWPNGYMGLLAPVNETEEQ